jgi:aspartate 1-decarboxylase
MQIEMLYSKIHNATISDANINYVGSITIDEELLEAANMMPGQKVDIYNVNNGERFTTYIIKGERGKRDMCVNGAAARKVHVGDIIIVVAYASYTREDLKSYEPTIVVVDEKNNVDFITHEIKG